MFHRLAAHACNQCDSVPATVGSHSPSAIMELDMKILFLVFVFSVQYLEVVETQSARLQISLGNETLRIREQFFHDLGNEELDLVILLERTRAIDKDYFNFYLRKLVNHTLRYYTKVSPSAVRLAILTFARNVTVHVDGLSSDLYKCELWEGNDRYWDTVLLNSTEEEYDYGNLKKAYSKTLEIFKGSKSTNSKRHLWLLTSGEFKSFIGDPLEEKHALIKMNVTIFGVLSGHWERRQSARSVLTSDFHLMGDPEMIVQFLSWTNHTVTPITAREPLLVATDNTVGCYCDVITGYRICDLEPCTDLDACKYAKEPCTFRTQFSSQEYTNFCAENPLFKCPYQCSSCMGNTMGKGPCRCRWRSGMTGPECTVREKECVPDACSNNATCVEPNNYSPVDYTCQCTSGYTGRFCRTRVTTTTTTTTSATRPTVNQLNEFTDWWNQWKVIIIGIAAGICFIMLMILILCCCCWCYMRMRRKNLTKQAQAKPETADAEVYTNPQTLDDRPETSYSQITEQSPERNIRRAGSTRIRKIARIVPFLKPPPPPPKPEGQFARLYMSQSELIKNKADDWKEDYQNCPKQQQLPGKGMKEWEQTVQSLLMDNDGVDDMSVLHKRLKRYIASGEAFIPSQNEIQEYINVLRNKTVDKSIKLKSKTFSITKNDGFILESQERDGDRGVLCVGKSRRYIMLGYMKNNHLLAQCRTEVARLVQHLVDEGM